MPGQYIGKLGQLIQLPAAQERADGSKALMMGRGVRVVLCFGDVNEGAELEYGENPAVTAHAFLQEQDRARRGEAYGRGDRQHEREQHRQRQEDAGAVEEALGR